jgi:hypothetical protein
MAIPKCFFVLLCIAIVVLNAGKNPFIDNHYISLLQKSNKQINLFYIYLKIIFYLFLAAGHATAEIAPCETLLNEGSCSNFPDCNQHCLSIGWKCGGLCQAPGPGAPLACLCKI